MNSPYDLGLRTSDRTSRHCLPSVSCAGLAVGAPCFSSWCAIHPAAGKARSDSLDAELIQAAGNGDTAAVQEFLQKGANIEAKGNDGDTPLLRAASGNANTNNNEVVKLLLERGANIKAKDNTGKTALDLATSGRKTGIVKLLRDRGAK